MKKRRQHLDIKYLHFTLPQIYYSCEVDGDDDDTNSMWSISTNSTMDNIPGTGRTIDTYFYQFFGRKIERLIFRISIAHLSPDRILHFLWVDNIAFPDSRFSLSHTIYVIRNDVQVAGLKSLVKQSQSVSLELYSIERIWRCLQIKFAVSICCRSLSALTTLYNTWYVCNVLRICCRSRAHLPPGDACEGTWWLPFRKELSSLLDCQWLIKGTSSLHLPPWDRSNRQSCA